MKTTFTLLVIASVILISVGCRKENLPVTSATAANTCPSYRTVANGQIRQSNFTADKKIQNAVACKVCHANKESTEQ